MVSERKAKRVDDDAVLALLYRSRPARMAEAVALMHQPTPDAAASIERLVERGLIDRRGERLSYHHPAQWAARAVGDDLAGLREGLDARLARVEGTVAALPALLRQWSVGETASDIVPVVTRHGQNAAEDLWFDTARADGGAAQAVFPTVERFLGSDADRRARFTQAFAAKGSVRAILPSSAAQTDALSDLAAHYEAAGVHFRTLDDPPSWFWVDGDLLALPFEWGEDWPTSVLGLRNASLADIARAYFDELWRRAAPLTAASPGWDPLLRLMRGGRTLDAASRELGINPRTGRRRVAAAMQHYGVSTLFSLGAAWGGERDAVG
jgi:hypothetical protein